MFASVSQVLDSGFPDYQSKLREFLLSGSDVPLKEAYELGKKNLADGMGLLDQTSVHQQALTALLEDRTLGEEHVLKRLVEAHRFLNEALTPFESARLVDNDSKKAVGRLIAVMENQSNHIAHRLHDECAQMLAVVFLQLAEISRNCSATNATKIQEVVGHLESVCEQMRELSHELRPVVLDQLGFGPALRKLANGVSKRTGLRITLHEEYGARLSPAIEVALYRTVQEALANIVRHARASCADVRVWAEQGNVYCRIADDGIGFEKPGARKDAAHGLGLLGIEERVLALGGKFRINSLPAQGTELQVEIPV